MFASNYDPGASSAEHLRRQRLVGAAPIVERTPMTDPAATDGETVPVEWRRASSDGLVPPLVERVPYCEIALEHPDLSPTRYGESFFPDAVPYEFEGSNRVFYWRPVLGSTGALEPGVGVCATTDELAVVPASGERALDLTRARDEGTEVVVDGTIAGDSTRALLGAYSPPDVRISVLSSERLELAVEGDEIAIAAGTRRRVALAERTVDRPDADGGPVEVTPALAVRFPGDRDLHHPAPGGEYRLFPSFGLDLDAVPSPVPVPTANGELDHAALAASLGVDLSDRPYPERVLWQAFAYEAFDPHADAGPRLAQFPDGHVALLSNAAVER